jgi:hypothetical protein
MAVAERPQNGSFASAICAFARSCWRSCGHTVRYSSRRTTSVSRTIGTTGRETTGVATISRSASTPPSVSTALAMEKHRFEGALCFLEILPARRLAPIVPSQIGLTLSDHFRPPSAGEAGRLECATTTAVSDPALLDNPQLPASWPMDGPTRPHDRNASSTLSGQHRATHLPTAGGPISDMSTSAMRRRTTAGQQSPGGAKHPPLLSPERVARKGETFARLACVEGIICR